VLKMFQSQTRSRSTCDIDTQEVYRANAPFQSQTRSRSTCDAFLLRMKACPYPVSISDEKPLHMRLAVRPLPISGMSVSISDEKPLHMRLINNGVIYRTVVVSISDEKPLHMRPKSTGPLWTRTTCFNLRREAAPHATRSSHTYAPPFNSFQSQTRSRSTCDFLLRITSLLS